MKVALIFLVLLCGIARAGDAVALLPLDADKSLEIYGQPVATEIARALVAGNVDVVVVGKTGVPERVRIVVDGRIAGDKLDNVVITLRVRDRFDGTVLDTLTTTMPLADIDRAAQDLSARLLPSVVGLLDKLKHRDPVKPPPPPPIPTTPAKPKLVLISMIADAPFKAPLAAEIDAWATTHHHATQAAEVAALGPDTAAKSIEKAGADLAIAFEVDHYMPESGMVEMARARVRVRISTAAGVQFDRIVVTDTVMGDKKISEADLAARVAREVLAIIAPHMKKAVPAW
jgi:hypothetical protein